jgi:hypothetical protein
MGGGRWTNDDWNGYTKSTRSARREEIFTNTGLKDSLNPAKIMLRESCDSADNPNSTPIIIGLDVTGSMGIIAEIMAKESLGTLVSGIYERRPIPDPHVMLMGIGDITGDKAPLQVTQFEADIRVANQLKEIWLEANGQGNGFESYDLPWYFAANRTAIDSFSKRGKKGYLFTIGDERPPAECLNLSNLRRVFGNTVEAGTTVNQALADAQQRYAVFHVIVEEGGYARTALQRVTNEWREKLDRASMALRAS